jgi:hypothetical protein
VAAEANAGGEPGPADAAGARRGAEPLDERIELMDGENFAERFVVQMRPGGEQLADDDEGWLLCLFSYAESYEVAS